MFTLRSCTALAVVLALAPAAPAQTWTGATATELWNTPGNWNPNTVPNSATAAVTFPDVTNSAFASVVLLTSVQVQSLTFTNTANFAENYNITSSGSPVLSGVTSITVGSAVATTDTINLNSVSTGSLVYPSGGSLTITNNAALGASPTLVIGPSTVIGTTGTGGITVAGTGYTRISGSFAGSGSSVISGLTKNGSGQLDLDLSASSNLGTLAVNAGSVTVGDGSLTLTASASHPLVVGNGTSVGSAATLTVSGGTAVTAGGDNSFIDGPTGTSAAVTGAGSQLHATFNLFVGSNNSGSLIVQNGGAVRTDMSLLVGDITGSSGTMLIQSGGTVNSMSTYIAGTPGSTGSVTVTGAGSTWSNGVSDFFLGGGTLGAGGPGMLTIADGGAVSTMHALTILTSDSSITVNGGSLSAGRLIVNSGVTPNIVLSDPSGGGAALTLGTDGSSQTWAFPFVDGPGGPGTVAKVGAGTLTLTGHLTNTGGYTASAGTIDFSGALVQPGTGSLTAAAGATIQYDTGTRVFGGFLRGPGTHVVTGGSTMTGVTSAASAVINVTGSATFASFTNGGALNVSAGVASPTTLNLFTNEGSGAITVAAASKISAADFQSYGTLTLTPGPSSSSATLLTNTGTTPLYFNGGSRTFLGTAATAINSATGQPADLAGINLNGQNAVVAGGLFVNNGFVADGSAAGTATIIADFGSLVKGAGFFQNSVITQNGGKFQAGNSPGLASFGSFVLGPGGVDSYVFAIDDATGTAGPHPNAAGQVSGWGLVSTVRQQVGSITTPGNFTWSADPADKLTLALDTLVNPTIVGTDVAGPMADFDPSQAYSWPAVRWTGSYSGPTDAQALDSATSFDTTAFENPINGTFGWSLDTADQTLSLTYTPTPVPEPGTLALTGMAAIGWVTFWRRRWQSNGPAATLSA